MDRTHLTESLKIAARQHGVIARDQLDGCGLTADQIAGLVADGVIVRIIDGAYRAASQFETEIARCAAVCLSRPGLTVSGPTAARLSGFRRSPVDGLVHVTAKPHAQPGRATWIRTYRTALLDNRDVITRTDGIRLTSRARTTVDMVRYATDAAVLSMVEQGIDQQWFSEQRLRSTAENTATPGRPFARRFLALLDDRIVGGPAGSDWESVVGEHLRLLGRVDLVRQYPLTVPGYGALRFDLAIPSLRWALEVDAHPSHHTSEGAARDKFRDRCCSEIGWLVQRVGEPDLRFDLTSTLDQIGRTIARRSGELERLRPTG